MRKTVSPTFGEYSLRLIDELRDQGRFGTSQTYDTARRSFESFLTSDIALDRMDRSLIARYNGYLRGRGVLRNTISFYNRALRAIYNKGVKEYGFDDASPFSGVYTGVDRTRSRALSERSLALVALLDTGDDAALTLARDMFIFSYAMRGMPFVDMAYLKKSQIRDGLMTYTRRKTGGTIRVRIEDETNRIIAFYSKLTEGSEYLFPVLCNASSGYNGTPEKLYTRYRSGLTSYNRNLKRLAAMAGITENISSYVARHSWASAARGIGSGVPVISEALGHSSERMTRIYMGSLDAVLVDRANRVLLDRLNTYCRQDGCGESVNPSSTDIKEPARRSLITKARRRLRAFILSITTSTKERYEVAKVYPKLQ